MSDDSLWFRPPPRPSQPARRPPRVRSQRPSMSSSTVRRRRCRPPGRSWRRAGPWESTRPRSATSKTSRRSTSAGSAWSSSRAHGRWSRPAPDASSRGWKSRPTRPACGCRGRWCSNSSARPWTSRPLPRPRRTRRSMAPALSATARRNRRRDAAERDAREPGHHHPPDGTAAETVAQPVKVDNDLYVRDYGEVHPLLQVRRGLRHRRPEHLRDRGRGPGLRRPDLDRRQRSAARFRVRLLRQLHRRLSDRGLDVP